jgi:CRISPR-associated protein Csx17
VFAALTREDQPAHWQAVLLAAAAMEAVLASGSGYKAGPIPVLSPDWLTAADDGSAEWRLACALGSAAASYRGGTGHFVSRPIDPVRHHWLPLQPGFARFAENDRRLAQDPRVVMHGREPIGDLVSLVQRRLIEAEQRSERRIGLDAAPGYHASLTDLCAVVSGAVDLTTVVAFARALMAIAWNRHLPTRRPTLPGRLQPDEAWIALRLASLPWPLPDGRTVPTDPAMIRRLAAGDGTGAVTLALRHLKSFGFCPPLSAAFVDADSARRWAASLAFPIS